MYKKEEDSYFSNCNNWPYKLRTPLKVIFLNLSKLKILPNKRIPSITNVSRDYYNNNSQIIKILKKHFKNLNEGDLIYLYYTFISQNFSSLQYFLNICDIMNTIIKHFFYFRRLEKKNLIEYRKYKNSYFEDYLIKRGNLEHIFNPDEPISEYRKLDIDDKMFFSYIPMKCRFIENKSMDCIYGDKCPFAHKNEEIFYHPILYKKIKCWKKKDKCPNKDKCCFFHENYEKMESEIDFDNETIKKMIEEINNIIIKNENEEKYFIEDLRNENNIPSEFNPITYKTHKCPLNHLCKLNIYQCLNYHDGKNDKRRPFQTYKAEFCENVFNEKKERIPNKICPFRDTCKKCHNKFEYMYHLDIFRKKLCPFDKRNIKCKNRLLCPYYHKDDSNEIFDENISFNKTMIICNPDVIKEYYFNLMDNYLKEGLTYYRKLKESLNLHKCPECHKNIMLFYKSYNQTNTGYIYCDKCINDKNEDNYENIKVKNNIK